MLFACRQRNLFSSLEAFVFLTTWKICGDIQYVHWHAYILALGWKSSVRGRLALD